MCRGDRFWHILVLGLLRWETTSGALTEGLLALGLQLIEGWYWEGKECAHLLTANGARLVRYGLLEGCPLSI